MGEKSFFSELKRRNIYRVSVVYALTSWVLVQIASVATESFGAPPWVMKIIITVILLGFPITLVITWAFEITPEGVRPTPTDEAQNNLSERNFWLGTGIITIILLGGWWYLTTGTATSKKSATTNNITDRSIAVLPLKSISGTKRTLPLAEGLHDDLLTRLANISDLKVISRTSVEKFENTELTLPAIADSLGVKWILEGNVQKGGDNVRINAQLIDPSSDTHIWAKTYQRHLTANNVFAIQGELARAIADALQAQLTADEQERIAGAPTSDLNAFKLYVKGRNLYSKGTTKEEGIKAAYYFGKAIQQDSTYALAWAGLSDILRYDPHTELSIPDSAYIPDVSQKQAAQRALKLAPDLAEAHSAMGAYYNGFYNRNAPAALYHYRKAIELKPSYAEAHQNMGTLLLAVGKAEKALDHLQLSEELNPTHIRIQVALYDALMVNKKYKRALAKARKYRQQYPNIGGHLAAIVRNLVHLKRYREADSLALRGFRKAEKFYDKYVLGSYLVAIKAVMGDTVAAKSYLSKLKRIDVPPDQKDKAHALMPTAYAALGDVDAAYKAYDKVKEWPYFAQVEIRYNYFPDARKKLQKDPRHNALIRELNEYIGLNPDGSIPKEPNF